MRLIDGDALVNVVETARKKARALTGIDFVMVMKDQPTIDAIPVEWLEAQIKSYTGDVSDIGKAARNGTIKDIIRKWQKELGKE